MANVKKGVTGFWWLEDLALSSGAVTGATNAFASLTGVFQLQKMDLKRKSDRAEIRDKSNNVAGEGYSNDGYEGSITGIPSGTTLAFAKTANVLPRAGDTIFLVDANETTVDPAGTGTAFIVDDADWVGEISKAREISIKFHRWADANVTKDAV